MENKERRTATVLSMIGLSMALAGTVCYAIFPSAHEEGAGRAGEFLMGGAIPQTPVFIATCSDSTCQNITNRTLCQNTNSAPPSKNTVNPIVQKAGEPNPDFTCPTTSQERDTDNGHSLSVGSCKKNAAGAPASTCQVNNYPVRCNPSIQYNFTGSIITPPDPPFYDENGERTWVWTCYYVKGGGTVPGETQPTIGCM